MSLIEELELRLFIVTQERDPHLLLFASTLAHGVLDAVGQTQTTFGRALNGLIRGRVIDRRRDFNILRRELRALAVLHVEGERIRRITDSEHMVEGLRTEPLPAHVEHNFLVMVNDLLEVLLRLRIAET